MDIKKLTHSRTTAVVAGASILVALGGVGGAVAANTVGSADIRNGAVHTVDIHDNAVTNAKLAPGVRGMFRHHLEADGPYPGQTQLQDGANSTKLWAGDQGATLQQSWVRCGRGKNAVGGGFGMNDGGAEANKGLQIVTSVPATIKGGKIVDTAIPGDPDGSIRPNGWVVEGFNNGTTEVSVRPWVVCAVMR
ncbi:hypothetical protein ACT8ZV_10110 [Nocardioides sp. MAHUQ-72]|uniref:hypothetical protein n=1 Tax=unclassified Nocardioides TaxID=2615069 RepID=UPI00361384E5